MKSDNQIISDARGDKERTKTKHSCGQSWITIYYDTDPAAWNDDLYTWIDDNAFADSFIANLKEITIGHRIASLTTRHGLKFIRSTPAQKAAALAQAIKKAAE